MSWFHEDPRRLSGTMPIRIGGGAGESEKDKKRDRMITVDELNSSHAVPFAGGIGAETAGTASWRRFMEHVFVAFRERRSPFGRTTAGRTGEDEDDDTDFDRTPDSDPVDPAVTRSLAVFERLFNLLLSPENVQRHAITAFDLTQYVCERLQPDVGIAKSWLNRLLNALTRAPPPADRREDVAAATLVLLARDYEPNGARTARARLFQLGFPISGQPPSSAHVQGFQSVLTQTIGFFEIWERVQTVRTFPEQIRAYLSALNKGQPSTEYGDLPLEAAEEWPVLEDAFSSQDSREKICVLDKLSDACPIHYMTLPSMERSKLRNIGIATAKNCRQSHVLIYPGD